MSNIIAAGGISIPPNKIFDFGQFYITNTMMSGLITVALIILFAVILRIFFIPKWQKNTGKIGAMQMLFESIVNLVDGSANENMEHNVGFVGQWYFAIMMYIFFGVMIEMTGLRPPISDLNVTLSLGLSTFILIQIFGAKEKKFKRLLHYCNPINIITDCVIPFSMALRLFGSVFSGYLIMHLIYQLPWWTVLVGVPAIGSVMFTIFHAVIQSYIFMILSMSFIGEATE